MMAIFGALIPRFVLLVAWSNDATYWAQTLFGGPVLFLGGFLFFPWTTLIYGLVQTTGLSILNLIFIAAAFLIDLGTWGIGVFATKQKTDSYMGS
jgi:hypothetical protein